MKRLIFLLGLVALTLFASSLGVDIERDSVTTNINSSDYWITNIGALGGVNDTQFDNDAGNLNIDELWLGTFITNASSVYCLLTGCNMTGDIDLGGNDINNAGTVTATSFSGDGSALTNLNFSGYYPHNQELNTTDSPTFQNLTIADHIEVITINASNITTRNINVTENSTIWLGGIPISSNLNFEGKRVVSFGNASSEQVFLDAFAYLGSGFYLTNISFENGTVIAIGFSGDFFSGGNFSGDNFTGSNAYFDFYDWTAEAPYLNFNGTYLYLNQTYLNNTILDFIGDINASALNFSSLTLNGTTIQDFSEVNYTVGSDTITFVTGSQSGTYSAIIPEFFSFEISSIKVTPTNIASSDKYRFAMYEVGNGNTIESDIILHSGRWEIEKSYGIDNQQVSVNFSQISPVNDFSIEIKYFRNQN